MKDHYENLEYINKIKPELIDVIFKYWDISGRPIRDFNEGHIIADIIKLEPKRGFDGFKENMNLIFPHQEHTDTQLHIYFTIFTECMEYVLEHIQLIKKDNET